MAKVNYKDSFGMSPIFSKGEKTLEKKRSNGLSYHDMMAVRIEGTEKGVLKIYDKPMVQW